MESKTLKYTMIGIGGMVLVATVGLYLYLTSETDEILDIESKEKIIEMLEDELEEIKIKPIKGEHKDPEDTNLYAYNKEFVVQVYTLITKYATKMKRSL